MLSTLESFLHFKYQHYEDKNRQKNGDLGYG